MLHKSHIVLDEQFIKQTTKYHQNINRVELRSVEITIVSIGTYSF